MTAEAQLAAHDARITSEAKRNDAQDVSIAGTNARIDRLVLWLMGTLATSVLTLFGVVAQLFIKAAK